MDLSRPEHGPVLMLSGMAIIGLIDNFVVEIAAEAGLWQFHLTRALMAMPMLVGLGIVLGLSIWPKRGWAVALRSFFLASAMLLYFGSIPMMPIALVVAGLFTSPIFVLIFSVIGLGVKVGRVRIVAVLVGFLGVLLILDPLGQSFSWTILAPIAGGALYALNAITTRRLCADESTVAMLVGFFCMLGLFGGIGLIVLGGSTSDVFALQGWISPNRSFLFWTFIQAAGSIIAIGLLTRAYQIAETTYLIVYEYSLLIFASFWGYMLYGQEIGLQAVLGMSLIVVSGATIARRTGDM